MPGPAHSLRIQSPGRANVTVETTTYKGHKCVRVVSLPGSDANYDLQNSGTGGGIVILRELIIP
jgi:hypothetical protein